MNSMEKRRRNAPEHLIRRTKEWFKVWTICPRYIPAQSVELEQFQDEVNFRTNHMKLAQGAISKTLLSLAMNMLLIFWSGVQKAQMNYAQWQTEARLHHMRLVGVVSWNHAGLGFIPAPQINTIRGKERCHLCDHEESNLGWALESQATPHPTPPQGSVQCSAMSINFHKTQSPECHLWFKQGTLEHILCCWDGTYGSKKAIAFVKAGE